VAASATVGQKTGLEIPHWFEGKSSEPLGKRVCQPGGGRVVCALAAEPPRRMHPGSRSRVSPAENPAADRLRRMVDHAAHLLPAQGPISVFIHHNTLHAFEVLPFEMAVAEAAGLFGCEPYLSEQRYRDELASGRIRDRDLERALELALGDAGAEPIGSWGTRLALRHLLLRHPVVGAAGAELAWLVDEMDALRRLRDDVPAAARERLLGDLPAGRGAARRHTRARLRALFDACTAAAARVEPAAAAPAAPLRHRDLLLAVSGADADALVHPLLIRVNAAFLDQGNAPWPLLDRELGLYRAFLRLYAPPGGPPEPWLRRLPGLLAAEDPDGDPAASALRSLEALGVAEDEWDPFLTRTLLALRGWAGMTWQVETRPDRVLAEAPPASLVGFLAVRLLLERCALAELAERELGFAGPLAGLRDHLRARLPAVAPPDPTAAGYLLFQLAQLHGRTAEEIAAMPSAEVAALLAEVAAFGDVERRRLFHLAYERRYRVEVLDALAVNAERPPAPAPPPRLQAIFCIDEREESIRRHLEEVEPACETFGAAGFFGVAMYYRGVGDAHAVPLCPIVVRPDHEVEEVPAEGRDAEQRRRALARRTVGRLALRMHIGSRTLARGTMITTLLGALAAVPLVARVLFPRFTALFRRRARGLLSPVRDTELLLAHRPEVTPAVGSRAGYTREEMAAIVARQLGDIGLLGRRELAPLVLVIGHGSSSLNNPHESAHDCGACGGGRGGPNARAFARMANDPEVRALLAGQGTPIPATTWFVAIQHNSCDDAMLCYDLDDVPAAWQEPLARARDALDRARTRNAHERCRRFESVPTWFPPALALAHVEARSEDLAQVRPEYGHATNAMAFIGRRSRTRGLFLDRRMFLVSYDPDGDDPDGTVLARLLAAVIPVVAGINLEYYFSYVDPTGYGCGTKLPHNVVGYLGVMDGHQSDLRTGLPWQMTEIHEPVRLTAVIEARPALLTRLLAVHPVLGPLVAGRWLRVAAMDPDSGALTIVGAAGLRPHDRESSELPVVAESADWYRGRRDHLPCARVRPPGEADL